MCWTHQAQASAHSLKQAASQLPKGQPGMGGAGGGGGGGGGNATAPPFLGSFSHVPLIPGEAPGRQHSTGLCQESLVLGPLGIRGWVSPRAPLSA